MSRTTHRPKGSMCIACVHADRDCSQLQFSAMPVMYRQDGEMIVRCTEFAGAKLSPCQGHARQQEHDNTLHNRIIDFVRDASSSELIGQIVSLYEEIDSLKRQLAAAKAGG